MPGQLVPNKLPLNDRNVYFQLLLSGNVATSDRDLPCREHRINFKDDKSLLKCKLTRTLSTCEPSIDFLYNVFFAAIPGH